MELFNTSSMGENLMKYALFFAVCIGYFGWEMNRSPAPVEASVAYDYCPECPEPVRMPFELQPIMEDDDR